MLGTVLLNSLDCCSLGVRLSWANNTNVYINRVDPGFKGQLTFSTISLRHTTVTINVRKSVAFELKWSSMEFTGRLSYSPAPHPPPPSPPPNTGNKERKEWTLFGMVSRHTGCKQTQRASLLRRIPACHVN